MAPAATKAVAKEINAAGYNAWIDKQLKPKKISDAKADGLVKKYLSFTTMTGKQVVKASHDMAWKAGKALSISRTVRHVFTKRYLYESMVDTMGDHLYVAAEGKVEDLVAWYDWAVLRKYALGKFSSMLYAAMRHPAMLVYLDNQLNSEGQPQREPRTRAARAPHGRRRQLRRDRRAAVGADPHRPRLRLGEARLPLRAAASTTPVR